MPIPLVQPDVPVLPAAAQPPMVVHFPDTALTFTDELIIDSTGARWRINTESQYDAVARVYWLNTALCQGEKTVTGRFFVSEDVVLGLDVDEDLRVLAVREIKKYLDRRNLNDGFALELPYPFML